ncbi:MAG: extracellular solute-binding protein [Oscillospiraceae bacterium]|jgi:raffinose/stachyose/melibiose transport system substrate-binding protein|nr:extracellular solute-binding protein [Oscillospiraceae bacterium]MBQ2072875.1 extracellular solute-binding protein [Oscillospiraceae bacterium]MBQ4016299.1 extracellular solute-binding protein [Oscillospiraceae bacterium]MBQ5427113.1 extracellular solute-binding protein [Oscillospiraceae bacterium]MBQ5787635.1 extracellular solute-binding protein [Oscillospiraceae bacterium]
MKKLLSLLLVMIMIVALAVPAYAANDEIIINFPSVWVGTDSKAPYMAQLIENFNAENAGSIKVVVEEQSDYQAARDKLRTTITTGATPDLCIMDTTYDIKGYSEAGKFMDLTPYLEEGWGKDFADGAFDAWSVDGKVYALPFESAIFTPIYNTKIFADIGWDHFPATYDEFFQFCEDAKAKGYNAMGQMAGENAWSSMLWYSLIVEAIGGKDVYANGLQDPAFVQAAEVLKAMYDYTFEGAISAGAGDVNGHWLARDTAIYLNGPWWVANLYKEDNAVDGVLLADDCEVALNPTYEGGKGEGGLVTTVQAFLAAAKQDDPAKEAAVVKFLKYLTDPQHVSELALSSGAMFFVKYEPSPDTNLISQKLTEVANNAEFTILHVNGAFPTAVSTEFPAAVSALVLGEVDAQGFVDQLQLAIDMAE